MDDFFVKASWGEGAVRPLLIFHSIYGNATLSLLAGDLACIRRRLASAQPGELGLDLSALLRSGFSDDEIQRLRRLRREGSPERLSRSWRLVRQRVTTGPWARPNSPGVPPD